VATLKQREDHPHFETLQTSTIFQTTTTILLLSLFKNTPPKRIEKFEYFLHAAILSNTLQALFQFSVTAYYTMVSCLNPFLCVIISSLHAPCI
jgi:hypothetical protein